MIHLITQVYISKFNRRLQNKIWKTSELKVTTIEVEQQRMDDQQQIKVWDPGGVLSTYKDMVGRP